MNKPVSLLLPFLLAGGIMAAQNNNIDTLLANAEKARLSYKFGDAVALYKEASATVRDSLKKREILAEIAKCENGAAMLEYGVKPVMAGSKRASFRDFFLYYNGLQDSTWSIVPQNLSNVDPSVSPRSVAYIREGTAEIIFSGKNSAGRWTLYSMKKGVSDTWSYPKPLNDGVNSQGDEIFPFLSPSGNELYFSSNGHYGMGGFDLYVSNRNPLTGDWDTPQNLGFPYSSPKNDYLYVNTDDGKYTYLASDRDITKKDSIKIYRLERDLNPVKRPFSDYKEILEVAALTPAGQDITNSTSVTADSNDSRGAINNGDEYSSKVLKVRQIQSEIDNSVKTISSNRSLWESLTNEADKKLLESKIAENELKLISLQSELRAATQEVQKIEMEFLQKGLLVPRITTEQNRTSEKNGNKITEFNPVRMSIGKFPDLIIASPVLPFNYSFRTESVSVVAPFDTIPQSTVFAIQLFLSSNKAEAKAFKGFSPVFEDITATGKYLYFCGIFYTYESAVSALTQIKKGGFPNAIVSSFDKRKSIPLKQARALIAEKDKNMGFRVTIDKYSNSGLPQEYIELIRKNTEKDIARTTADGKTIYFIGTFNSRDDAEKLKSILTTAGVEGVSVEEIKLQ